MASYDSNQRLALLRVCAGCGKEKEQDHARW